MNGRTSVTELAAPADNPQFFVWSFPGSPVRILLKLDIVTSMVECLMPGLKAGVESPREAGGFLLGVVRPLGVEISAFEPFRCEQQDDSLFVVSGRDKERFEEAMDRLNRSGSPTRVIGYFRGQLRGDLSLRSEDLALIKSFFTDPASVFLLVKPEGELLTAGFFFRIGEDVCEDTFMPFCFDKGQLEAEARAALLPAITFDEELTEPNEQSAGASRKRFLAFALGTALVLVIAAIAATDPFSRLGKKPPPAPLAPVSTPLALSAKLSKADLTIVWDTNSGIVKNARLGVMTIRGDQKQEEVPLTAAMLRAGKLVYKHTTGKALHVSIEVFTSEGETTRESLIAVFNDSNQESKSPAPAPQTPVSAALSVPTPAPKEAKPAEKQVAARFELPQPKRQPEPVVLAPEPPALEQKQAALPQATLPIAAQVNIPKMEAPAASPPPKPTEQAVPQNVVQPPAAKAATQPVQAAPLVPPRPIQQARPELAANLRRMVTHEVHVQVRVAVDATGKVIQTEALSTKGAVAEYLQRAATTAARLWRFEPARINGNPVPGELVLEFRFAPENR